MTARISFLARPAALAALAAALSLGFAAAANAGGTSENILLIINPSDPDSMYVGNYYRHARQIPDSNVLYMNSDAANYAEFVDNQLAGFLGTLSSRDLYDHIDYVVIAPGAPYRLPASGYINDGCSPVNRFAISSCYGMAFLTDRIFGGWQSIAHNEYSDTSSAPPIGFDSEIYWLDGEPSNDPSAQRMFIGALLGYTGERGNTVPEIIAMIDQSVGADGTFPEGTFYFMETNDQARSGPRHNFYPNAVALIQADGGMAEHRCCAALPAGEHDCLGIMTGLASPDIDGTDMTILPGAFCDHLTSYAGHFDTSGQVKMSRWIANGASGTWGTVEEPCNYPGKFPHPYTHVQYHRGMSLGEAVMRNIGFVPFQGLLLGDPMTRPYTHIPEVSVPDAPTDPVAGIVRLTPEATTTHPTAKIESFDLLVDGRLWGNVAAGLPFGLDTTRFSDGWHELRVIAYDDTDLRSAGSWIGAVEINNHGQSTVIDDVSPTSGDLSTAFVIDATANTNGANIVEVRVVHHGRVIASASDDQASMVVHGRMIGAGVSDLLVETLLDDGSVVSSAPVEVDIVDDPGTPAADAPVAFSYTTRAISDGTIVIELPATYDDVAGKLTYSVLSDPAQSTVHPADPSLPYRIVTVDPGASGVDEMTFQVSDGVNQSNIATVYLAYQGAVFGRPHLSIGPLRVGEIGEFTVTSGYPNDAAWLAYSLKGFGQTYVPALNVRLDLRQPKQAGKMKLTDENGFVEWMLPIPNVKTPKRVFFQALQRSVVSNPEYADVTN